MPAGYRPGRGSERGGARRARQEHVVGAGADLPSSSCSRSCTTSAASSRRTTSRRCGRTSSSTTGWRKCSTRCSTSSSGRSEHDRLTMRQKEQAVDDLIALVGAVDGILQAQSAADAQLLPRDRRPALHGRGGGGHRRAAAARLPLAVHRLRRAAPALRAAADRHDHRGADGAHPGRAGADRQRLISH